MTENTRHQHVNQRRSFAKLITTVKQTALRHAQHNAQATADKEP